MGKHLIILRGPSGCGKSTKAKKIADLNDCVICSADDFFINSETGDYDFDITKLAEAHNDCFNRFLQAVKDQKNVIIDNTNIHPWEYQNYIEVAEMMGYSYDVHTFHVETVEQVAKCIDRNSHGVPPEVIWRMTLDMWRSRTS